eukprot:GABV01011025.1.p1 GENE.GABV01011025.1~~GABV01011025.1.p1  ORF type:complete len:110 (+),score=17.08 GABV01011025.1:71-400(+)
MAFRHAARKFATVTSRTSASSAGLYSIDQSLVQSPPSSAETAEAARVIFPRSRDDKDQKAVDQMVELASRIASDPLVFEAIQQSAPVRECLEIFEQQQIGSSHDLREGW